MARQTILFVHGVRISRIEELQANFDVEDFRSQTELDKLVHWLQITGLVDQASLVPKTPDDQDLENKLIAAIGLSTEQIKEYRDAKRRKQEALEAEQRRLAEAEQRRLAEEERKKEESQKTPEKQLEQARNNKTVFSSRNVFYMPFVTLHGRRIGVQLVKMFSGTEEAYLLEPHGGKSLQVQILNDDDDNTRKVKKMATTGLGVLLYNSSDTLGDSKYAHVSSLYAKLYHPFLSETCFLIKTSLNFTDLMSLENFLSSDMPIQKIVITTKSEVFIYK